jgi:hypothetical protein
MLDVGGQDATEAFEDVGHSDEARETLDQLLVGTLKRQVRTTSINFRVLSTAPASKHYTNGVVRNSLVTPPPRLLSLRWRLPRTRLRQASALPCTASSSSAVSWPSALTSTCRLNRASNKLLRQALLRTTEGGDRMHNRIIGCMG